MFNVYWNMASSSRDIYNTLFTLILEAHSTSPEHRNSLCIRIRIVTLGSNACPVTINHTHAPQSVQSV